MDEAGIKGFDISQWQGVLAPAGTPRAIVSRLNAEVVKAMRTPEMHERMVTQGGNEVVTGTPEEVARSKMSHTGRYLKPHLSV